MRVATDSTAAAAEQLGADREPGVAVVAARRSSELHSVPVAAEGIADAADNWTRFLVLRRDLAGFAEAGPPPHRTLVRAVPADGATSLPGLLASLHRRAVPLLALHPAGRSYLFEIRGHHADAAVAGALSDMRGCCGDVVCMGSYGEATLP